MNCRVTAVEINATELEGLLKVPSIVITDPGPKLSVPPALNEPSTKTVVPTVDAVENVPPFKARVAPVATLALEPAAIVSVTLVPAVRLPACISKSLAAALALMVTVTAAAP